eukprot:scaffold11808_cov97-Alexandrium_tamarense.AAC.1
MWVATSTARAVAGIIVGFLVHGLAVLRGLWKQQLTGFFSETVSRTETYKHQLCIMQASGNLKRFSRPGRRLGSAFPE